MALIDHVYKASNRTLQFDDSTDTLLAQAVNGDDGDGVIYVTPSSATNKIQDSTDPGVNQIVVSIVDTLSGAGDVVAADLKLATSQGNLGSATGGASLNIGATILGSSPSVEVWYRWANSVGDGEYTNIELEISERIESAI